MQVSGKDGNAFYSSDKIQKQAEIQTTQDQQISFSSEISAAESNKSFVESDITDLSSKSSDVQSNIFAASANVATTQGLSSDTQNIHQEQKTKDDDSKANDYSRRNRDITQVQAALEQAQQTLEENTELDENNSFLQADEYAYYEDSDSKEEKDYEKYEKQIQDAFYGGFFGLGTDEKTFEAIINNEELDGEDWANIINVFETETNKSFIDEVNLEYGTVFDKSAKNEIMEKLALKLAASVENDSETALDTACNQLYSALGKDNNGSNDVAESKKFVESLLLNSSDKTCAEIIKRYKELTNCDLAEDIKSSELSTANKDLIEHKIQLANEYDIQNSLDNMTISQINPENYSLSDQNKIWTINVLINGLNGSVAELMAQNEEDGIISGAFNSAKVLTGLGVSSSDVISSLEQEEKMIKELTSAINGESDLTFEETFKKWTGVDYDEEKIIQYQEDSNNYQIAYIKLLSAQNFQEKISQADNLQGVYDAFSQYYGEDTAQEKMLEYLSENMTNKENNAFEAFGNPVEISFNDEGQLVVVRALNYSQLRSPNEALEYETTVYDLAETTNMIKSMPRFFDNEKSLSDAQANLEEKQSIYYNSKQAAIGNADKLEETLNKYCASQDGFIDKLANAAQIAGMGTVVVGGVVTLVNPPAGVGIMSAGNYMALGGMFGDNVLHSIDAITSEKGLSKEEFNGLLKETLTEVGYLALGSGINKLAQVAQTSSLIALQNAGLSENSAKVLSWLVEGGSDVSLSVLSDYMITGDPNLNANTLQVLMGILTGVANAKVTQYKNTKVKELLTEVKNPSDLTNAKLYDGFREVYGDSVTDIKIDENLALRYNEKEGISLNYTDTEGKPTGSILIDPQHNQYYVDTKGRKYKIDKFENGQVEFTTLDNTKYTIDIGDSNGFKNIMSVTTFRDYSHSPLKEFSNSKISDISEVFSSDKLTTEQKTYAQQLYNHICDIGYKDFIEKYPNVFKDMFIADLRQITPDGSKYGYIELDANHFENIKYAAEQNFDSVTRQAIDDRINDSCPHQLWQYYDNYDAIPQEGIGIWSKEECIKFLEGSKPLVDALDQQSIPAPMTVNRVAGVSVFANQELNGKSLSELMTSRKPEDIQMVLDYFNGNNNVSVYHDNVLGTTLSSNNAQTNAIGQAGKVYWNLDVPEGTKGLFLESCCDDPIYSEMEFLLDRGSSFVVKNAEYRNGAWYIDAVVVQD